MSIEKAALCLTNFFKRIHTCPISYDIIPLSKQVYLKETDRPFHIESLRSLIFHEGKEAKNPLTRTKLDPTFIHHVMKRSTSQTNYNIHMSAIKSVAQLLTYLLDQAWKKFQTDLNGSSDPYAFLVDSTTQMLLSMEDAYTRDCILELIPPDHACMLRVRL